MTFKFNGRELELDEVSVYGIDGVGTNPDDCEVGSALVLDGDWRYCTEDEMDMINNDRSFINELVEDIVNELEEIRVSKMIRND